MSLDSNDTKENNNMKDLLHIGSLIKAELKSQEMPVEHLADLVHVSPTAIYHIMRKYSIDTERLMSISVGLGKNFFAELSAECEKQIREHNNIH